MPDQKTLDAYLRKAPGQSYAIAPAMHRQQRRPDSYGCSIWLVHGRERNLLVDSGSGLVSLSEQVVEDG